VFELPKAFLESADFYLKLLAGLGAVLAFVVSLRQYRLTQLWKRKEFLGAEVNQFLRDPAVRNALLMVDWGSRRIPFDPAVGRECWPKVTRSIQVEALEPHALRTPQKSTDSLEPRRFSPLEAQIRDTYDALLDGLERFAAFADSGLYDPPELEPYLRYWIRQITSNDGSLGDRRWLLALLAYMEYYGFRGTQRLLAGLGHDVMIGGRLWTQLRSCDQNLAARLEGVLSGPAATSLEAASD
jgi:hypothetical protein